MESNTAVLLLLLALSASVIQVRCDEDNDDTSVVDAADLGDIIFFPDYENNYTEIKCRETEEYSTCNANPVCQRTCENLHAPGIVCPKRRACIEGCICKKNFVRSELYGGCIPQDQCGRVKH